jgi:hypothetical protein
MIWWIIDIFFLPPPCPKSNSPQIICEQLREMNKFAEIVTLSESGHPKKWHIY